MTAPRSAPSSRPPAWPPRTQHVLCRRCADEIPDAPITDLLAVRRPPVLELGPAAEPQMCCGCHRPSRVVVCRRLPADGGELVCNGLHARITTASGRFEESDLGADLGMAA